MRHRPDPEASQENLARLSPALKELGAWIRTEAVPEGLPFSHRQIAPGHVRHGQRSGGAGSPEVVASDDEQVQVPAYGGQRLGADAAQLTSGSLIGHGTNLLGHGE